MKTNCRAIKRSKLAWQCVKWIRLVCLEYTETKDHFGVLCFEFLCLEHVETKDHFGATRPS